MALSSEYKQEIFVEVFEKGYGEGVNSVTRREDVSSFSDEQRLATARHFAGRIDRDMFGVRLARVTTETLQVF